MKLDLNAIEAIVKNEKNAGGFAELIRDFKKIGVKKYDYLVEAGVYRYYADESFIEIQMNGKPNHVAEIGSAIAIRKAVTQAQAGAISFEQFAKLAGLSGVAYWRTDLLSMEVDYIDLDGNILLSELIPEVN